MRERITEGVDWGHQDNDDGVELHTRPVNILMRSLS